MSLSPTVIAHMEHLLQCPVSGQRVRWMSNAEITQLNQAIETTGLMHYSQEPVERKPVSGFITLDENIIYPVENGIVLMLPEFAIIRNRETVPSDKVIISYSAKVRTFYESFGWEKNEAGTYKDTSRHVDLRPVVRDYLHRCLMRVKDYLPDQGTYLLDVASGPLAFPEHQRYSENYEIRICVDIALPALLEAQGVLPDERGIFILGDIVNLPLLTGVVDAAVSLHTIYHVPADNQPRAFGELFRALSTGGCAIVVYSWGNSSLLMNLTIGPLRLVYQLLKWFRQRFSSRKRNEDEPSLYFHAYSWRWFLEQNWGFDLEIYSWRSLNQSFMRYFIHPFLFGKQILEIFFWLEKRFPKTMGRIGQYPLIIFHKNE
jgi:ubiquinone/menaquinone biosynthesis C-methylase UbiE